MSAWAEIRRQARAWHLELQPQPGLAPAATLLAAAQASSGVKVLRVPPDDVLLDGGEACYDPEGPRILISEALSPEAAAFHLAHEFGHHRLHGPGAACRAEDFDPLAPAEPESSLVGEDDCYSPKQRREAQANVFARELLLPRDKLRAVCAADRPSSVAVAASLGVEPQLVAQQMADALLLPDDPSPQAPKPPPPPDASQEVAIAAGPGPRQVRAGPGAGKTRTLVGRIARLVAGGEAPSSILALTYSNDSADDLAQRIGRELGADATAVWCSTFHAFGQELLRRYGAEIGLPAVRLVDRVGSLLLLERALAGLTLDHYLDLQEPLRALRSVLGAISRAKDEMCGPDAYRTLAAAITDDDARQRALEVAHIYKVYQAALEAEGAVDFGDLILRSIELLETRPDIRDLVRAEWRHVLVDEYQDMNRASAALLKQLVEPGAGPWVVGDVRQAIYRFRGASPRNMSRFGEQFPGAKDIDLKVNYRSGGRIVRVFEAFGAGMDAKPFAPKDALEPHRGRETGELDYHVATTREAEAEGIARAIGAAASGPGAYRRHAVLARSHGVLSFLAAHFERAGVPALYFGEFFEREEVRDLLSLLSLVAERDGLGLLRIAQAARYQAPVADILALIRFREDTDIRMAAALRRLHEAPLSDAGRAGLARLAADVAGVSFATTPHAALSAYLFDAGAVHGPPFVGDDVAAQQRRLAAYQLLQLAFSFRGRPGQDPKRAFLDHVRRLEVLEEEKELRRPPAAAAGIDAVRLMTVHAAKGLEYPVVHLPSLSPSYFPAPGRYDPCPPPPGLIPVDPLMGAEAEEDSLFFVALSRAEDRLVLSRALRYGGASRPKRSRLLDAVAPLLPPDRDAAPDWVEAGAPPPAFTALRAPDPPPSELAVAAVEDYLRCPRRYYYAEALGLGRHAPASPFLRFHSVLRSGFSWLQERAADARDGLRDHVEASWAASAMVDEPFADHYRAASHQMLQQAAVAMDGTPLGLERNVEVAGVRVTLRADHIQLDRAGVVIRRLKAGRLARSGETPRARYGLLQATVARDEGVEVRFEHVSLASGEVRDGTLAGDKRGKALEQVAGALEGIAAGRFDPVRNPRHCPTCPFFFICPSDGLKA